MDILSSRVILRPADYEHTLAFYRDLLDLAVAREYPGGTVFFAGQSLIEIAAHGGSGVSTSGAEPAERPMYAPFEGALWLQVRDVSATQTELVLKGVAIDRPVRQEPWGLHEMWIRDPDGVRIVFVEVPDNHPIRKDSRKLPNE
jgi:catechol 2,3-dioxygenase-like lactoylglutathione lyase family enzyme